LHSDPELVAARRAGYEAAFATPEARERRRQALRAAAIAEASSPEGKARRRRLGHEKVAALHTPEAKARSHSPEARARRGRQISERYLSWCPIEYREHYRLLIRSKRMLSADARAAIEDLIKVDARRYARTGKLQQAARA